MQAVLFDLDGTLVDNMRFHFRAWRETAASLGVALDDARIQRDFAGKKNDEIIPALLDRAPTAQEIAKIANDKEARYRELARAEIAFLSGARRFIEDLRANAIKTAIASAAPPENRRLVLDTLSAWPLFDAVAGGEEAARGKPWPDIFLLAAERLGVAPQGCWVFEDAVLGVQAAVAAGAQVIGVTTSEAPEHLRAAGARATIADFSGLSLAWLASLG